jgi:hypothetical protein
MNTRKYWPLDYDPECEIYDNPAWNMPGFRNSIGNCCRQSARPRNVYRALSPRAIRETTHSI